MKAKDLIEGEDSDLDDRLDQAISQLGRKVKLIVSVTYTKSVERIVEADEDGKIDQAVLAEVAHEAVTSQEFHEQEEDWQDTTILSEEGDELWSIS